MSDNFFDIPGDVIKEAEAAANFGLVIPENAREGKDGSHYWFEAGTVKSASSSIEEKNPAAGKVNVFKLQTTINGEGSGKNLNRPIGIFIRINFEALKKRRPENQFTMSRISVHRLKTLFRSLDIEGEMDDGGYSSDQLAQYFPPEISFEKEISPFVNRIVYFEVKQPAPGAVSKQGKPLGPEITKFVPRI